MRFTTLLPAFCIFVSGVCAATPPTADLAVWRSASSLSFSNNFNAPIQCGKPGCQPGWYYGDPQHAPSGLACLVGGLLCDVLRLLLGCNICPVGPPPVVGGGGGNGGNGNGGNGSGSGGSGTGGGSGGNGGNGNGGNGNGGNGNGGNGNGGNGNGGNGSGSGGSGTGGGSGSGSGGDGAVSPPPPTGYAYDYTNLTCATQVWPPSIYITYGLVQCPQGCADMCDSIAGCIYANYFYDVNARPEKNPSNLLTCSLFTIKLARVNATNCGGQQLLPLPGPKNSIADSYAIYKPRATVAH